jgi:phosphatidylglycerol---prolipoprotein diacylglyceryl transferase
VRRPASTGRIPPAAAATEPTISARRTLRRVQPEIHVLGITIQSFGLMMALGFVVAGIAAGVYLKELGRPVDWAYEMIFAALVGGIVGARLWWVAENWSDAKGDVLGSLFSGSGLVWYGGAIGGAVAVLAWAWRRHVLDLVTLDVAAVPLAAGYAIGRIGCQLAGDGDYGKAWDGPWAMAYPHGTVPTTTPVHPTPVYETLAMGLVALLLWRWRHRWQPGTLFALYLVLAGVERFLVEFIRRNEAVLLGLTQPQVISVIMIAGGGTWLWLRRGAVAPAQRAAARV